MPMWTLCSFTLIVTFTQVLIVYNWNYVQTPQIEKICLLLQNRSCVQITGKIVANCVDINLCMTLKFSRSHCSSTKMFFGGHGLDTVFRTSEWISLLTINFMLILLPSTSREGTVPATGTRPTAAAAGDATTITSRTLGKRGGFLYLCACVPAMQQYFFITFATDLGLLPARASWGFDQGEREPETTATECPPLSSPDQTGHGRVLQHAPSRPGQILKTSGRCNSNSSSI